MRRVAFFLGCLIAVARAESAPLPPIVVTELSAPLARGARGATLFTAPDRTVWLAWVEPGSPQSATASGGHQHRLAPLPAGAPSNILRFATLDAAAQAWSKPRIIARDSTISVSASDCPQIVVDAAGRATAVWTEAQGGARFSQSPDRGLTWSAPDSVTRESNAVEMPALTALADGRVLVAWLDARSKPSGGKATPLYARILAAPGPDTMVDASVCDCCPPALAPFLDGGALLAYRGRTAGEVRDILTARFDGRDWQTPRLLNNDGWRIAGCPVNGPRLASDLGRVSAAWFTAADNAPRVLASYSPDAGARFLQPLPIDRGYPAGHVDTLILRDSTLLVTWVENDGSLWLRRVNPDFSAGEPLALAPKGAVAMKSFPRCALVRDYAGGAGTAQFVTVYGSEGEPAFLHTLLVTVPEGALLAAQSDCGCTPTPEQLAGVSVRGTVVATAADHTGLRVRHEELAGVMAAGTHEFRAAPNVVAAAAPGRDFLARITQRDGAWWLFDVHLLGVPPRQR